MCRAEFDKTVRPYVSEFPIGERGVGFDRQELDDWATAYVEAKAIDKKRAPEQQLPRSERQKGDKSWRENRSDLLPSLLFKINQNQLALEAAIMELTLWVEHRGSAEGAENVRGALDTISKNEEFIKMTLAVLMAPE
jgi:hypothetical protein